MLAHLGAQLEDQTMSFICYNDPRADGDLELIVIPRCRGRMTRCGGTMAASQRKLRQQQRQAQRLPDSPQGTVHVLASQATSPLHQSRVCRHS